MAEPIPDLDPGAVRNAAALTFGPVVFLLHFTAVYGFNAVACAFGFAGSRVAGIGAVPFFVLVATVVAVVVVLVTGRTSPTVPTEGQTDRQYDLRARAEFVAKMRAMVSWLASAAMLVVALPAMFARAC